MKVTIIGTGTSQGIPVIGCGCVVCKSLDFRDKRTRSSVYIENQGLKLIIDTGPDFRQQLLREKINSIDAILYTHEHKDHTGGLDDVRPINFLQKKRMPIYALPRVLNQLKQDYFYAFAPPKHTSLPQLELFEITENKPFFINSIEIIPFQVRHEMLPIVGFRIGDFSYITDGSFLPESTFEILKGTKILVINGLQKEPHVAHFTVQQAIEIIQRIKPEKAYLTHISHTLGLHSEIKLPPSIELGYDGLQFEV